MKNKKMGKKASEALLLDVSKCEIKQRRRNISVKLKIRLLKGKRRMRNMLQNMNEETAARTKKREEKLKEVTSDIERIISQDLDGLVSEAYNHKEEEFEDFIDDEEDYQRVMFSVQNRYTDAAAELKLNKDDANDIDGMVHDLM
jgi:hypothetical protein